MSCDHRCGYDLVCLKIPDEELNGTWACVCKRCMLMIPFSTLKGLEDVDAETVWREIVVWEQLEKTIKENTGDGVCEDIEEGVHCEGTEGEVPGDEFT